ncbi:hypothetical protein HO173_011978 [Letharia columbiana]|uniref:Uncharacterized protein n=1 Tax=Letharia columbiana TaxID=112416 RepID=A0A8H6CQ06_9LECA|nr:uncharacterized protein HO173_011978 [Letharia columbiana]KAF6227760.1 hypothetical protein HO173_011978 [Letharia columbiana]
MAASSRSKPNLWHMALSKLPEEKQVALRSGFGSSEKSDVHALTAVVTQVRQRALLERWKIKSHHGEVAV